MIKKGIYSLLAVLVLCTSCQDKSTEKTKITEDFITEYAADPEKFEIIKFGDWGEYSSGGVLESFEIYCTYYINDIEGSRKKCGHYFEFDPEGVLVSIKSKTDDPAVRVHITEDWFKKYGRELSQQDSLTLNFK